MFIGIVLGGLDMCNKEGLKQGKWINVVQIPSVGDIVSVREELHKVTNVVYMAAAYNENPIVVVTSDYIKN